MGLTSLQVCMETSDWLQGTVDDEERGMDSSSPSGGDMITCSRVPLMERRLRPPHDQALKCPRCDSTHTKFCYYNNYSLSQPRYFCKTCRRYWTKGGTLRNIPVGGGCRKNKKVSSSSKKSNNDNNNNNQNIVLPPDSNPAGSSVFTPTDLQLSFPEMQFSNLFGNHGGFGNNPNPSFMEAVKYNSMFENPRAIDFMESSGAKYDQGHFGHDLGMMGGLGGDHVGNSTHGLAPNYHHHAIHPFGMMSLDGQNGNFMDTSFQMALLPYNEANVNEDQHNAIEVKPNAKLLSLEWQDQGCSDAGKDSFGYISGLGSWTGMMNGYGPSTTNPLV